MKKSFTLIELIVVIAIIAVLAAIIAPNAFRAIEKAKISKMISDLKAVKTAFLALYTDVGEFPRENPPTGYPVNPAVIDTDVVRPILFNSSDGWDGPYLEGSIENHPWAAIYRYDNDGDCYVPGVNPYGGANVFWYHTESSLNISEMATLAEKIDRVIDGDNDATAGKVRLSPPPPADPIVLFYAIFGGC